MAITFGYWIVLSVAWAIASRGASEAASEESAASRALHLALVNGAVLLAYWPFAGWPAATTGVFEFPRIFPPGLDLAAPALAIGAAGCGLALWARRHLGRHWSAAVTAKVDHELVRSGPYRLIRHPIYAGAIAMYLAPALVSGRLQGPLAMAVILLAYVRKIGMEERTMRGLFGPAYDAYVRETWALVPWVY